MKIHRYTSLFAPLLLCVAMLAPSAMAQSLPSGPITIVVPFPPGGVTDVVARSVANELSRLWKQPVVVDNRPGAGGNIGAAAVARSAGDGRTLLFAGTSIVINAVMQDKVPYTLMEDLQPVTQVADLPFLIVVHDSVPAKTLPEFVQYAKQHPGELNFGSGGNGTSPHVAGELFKQKTQTDIVHIPFKGAAAATTDLLAGRIQLMVDSAQGLIPHVQKGDLRALATPRAERIPSLPDVPTVKESSSLDIDVSSWLSLWAPGGTPAELMDRISRDVATVLAKDGIRESLLQKTVLPVGSSRNDFTAFVKTEMTKWGQVIDQAQAKAQ
ncbi:Bug family tripartite tricarboxylate transporter substrate binding protein [Parapusillimonas sp. JC17]|uniref:Bug family tripartite tricarboxylate transporter substrate binding protein n=1 Tax=Parapusillimonas sp. JC17 TaxID=3445768 RepID=UPI003FA0FF20